MMATIRFKFILRLIAGTNRDLKIEVAECRFRE